VLKEWLAGKWQEPDAIRIVHRLLLICHLSLPTSSTKRAFAITTRDTPSIENVK
jgi:hypothetical protein